jgi:SPP1 family predicted phage head-tail adaptor
MWAWWSPAQVAAQLLSATATAAVVTGVAAGSVAGSVGATGAAVASVAGVASSSEVGAVFASAGGAAVAPVVGVSAGSSAGIVLASGSAVASIAAVSSTSASGFVSATGQDLIVASVSGTASVSLASSVGAIGGGSATVLGASSASAAGIVRARAGQTARLWSSIRGEPRVRAPDLGTRIVIQQRATSQTARGQQVREWTDVCTVWSRVRQANGREVLAGQAINAAVSAVIEIRWRDGVSASMRVVDGSRIYNVEAVVDKGRHLELQCSTGAHDE